MSDDQGVQGHFVSGDFSSTCFTCGGKSTVRNGKRRTHLCRLRLIRRYGWRRHLEGWHEAHRWAVEHPDDPMVLADAYDYGSGWAGFMRVGGGAVEMSAGGESDA